MAIRSRSRGWARGRQVSAALLLVLLPAPEAALAALRGAGHRCGECRQQDSCPVRPAPEPVKPAAPGCHQDHAARHQPAPPPAPAGPALEAACPCGLPHAPAVSHRDTRAVLEAAPAALFLPPAGALAARPVSRPPSHLPVPEAPPPRSAVPA